MNTRYLLINNSHKTLLKAAVEMSNIILHYITPADFQVLFNDIHKSIITNGHFKTKLEKATVLRTGYTATVGTVVLKRIDFDAQDDRLSSLIFHKME